MKKALCALFAIVFVSSMCFAEEVSTSSAEAVPAGTETATGSIDSVSTGGGKRQMTVRGEDRALTVFSIAPDATIIGKDGKATTVTWLKGNKVSIGYVMSQDGSTRMAKSIKVLSDF